MAKEKILDRRDTVRWDEDILRTMIKRDWLKVDKRKNKPTPTGKANLNKQINQAMREKLKRDTDVQIRKQEIKKEIADKQAKVDNLQEEMKELSKEMQRLKTAEKQQMKQIGDSR